MGKREQQERARKIAQDVKKRHQLLERYKKDDPVIRDSPPSPLSRIEIYYLDMSGTQEADEKNKAFLRSLTTTEGRQRLFTRYINDIMKVDAKIFVSNDMEMLLDYYDEHPDLFYLCFESNYSIASMSQDIELSEEANEYLRSISPYLQMGGNPETHMRFAAMDEYLLDFPESFDTAQAAVFFADKTDNSGMAVILPIGYANEQAVVTGKGLDVLTKNGFPTTKLLDCVFFDEKGQKMPPDQAIDALGRGNSNITYRWMTEEELEKRNQLLAHPEKYGYHTAADSKTELTAFPGVTGVGVSSSTTSAMESVGGKGAFYGGLDLTAAMADDLRKHPVSQMLNITKTGDDSYSVSYRLPERGKSPDGTEFDIRTNINMFTQVLAKMMFDEHDNMRLDSSIEKFIDVSDRLQSFQNPILTTADREERTNSILDMLELPDGETRRRLSEFIMADISNSVIFERIVNSVEVDARNLATYSQLLDQQDGTELNSNHRTWLRNSHDDYISTIRDYRHLKEMNPLTETGIYFPMTSDDSAVINQIFASQLNRLHPEAQITGQVVNYKYPENIDGESNFLSTPFSSNSCFAVEGVKLGENEVLLSLETTVPPANRLLFNPDSRSALGVFSSIDEIKASYSHDGVVYINDFSIKDRTRFTIDFEANTYAISDVGVDSLQHELEMQKYPKLSFSSLKLSEAEVKAGARRPVQELADLFTAFEKISGSEAGNNRITAMTALKAAAKAYLDAHDPKGDPAKTEGLTRRDWQQINFARNAFGFACADINAVKDANPRGFQSPYEQLRDAKAGADEYFRGSDHINPTARKMLYDTIRESLADNCHLDFAPGKLAKKNPNDLYEYLDDPDTGKSLRAMTMAAYHSQEVIADMRRLDPNSVDEQFEQELEFKGEMYKVLLEGAQVISDPQTYMGEHPNTSAEAFNRMNKGINLALKALPAFDSISANFAKGAPMEFISANGGRLTPAQAARAMLSGEPAMVVKPGSTLECFRLAEDGKLSPEPYINPASPDLHNTDYKQLCGQLYSELKRTDQAYVWSNSDAFAELRDTLKEMSDARRDLTPEQQRAGFRRVEMLSASYLAKKTKEFIAEGSLDKRSTDRMRTAYRVHALAGAFKDPAAYAQLAQPQVQNPQAGQPGIPQN